jgi:organic radical activating enzyme
MTDKDNKVFCISPWIHIHTWPNEKVYPCCLTPMDQTVGDLSVQTLEEVWNDAPMRELRTNMLSGKQSSSCQRCYEFEDSGQRSMRLTLNSKFKHHLCEIEKTKSDGTYEKLNLVYWDFRFSNICNFKCRMCGPQLSTGWYDETKKIYGRLPNDVPKETDPDELWNQVEPLFNTVEEIYFAGGEPLIMEEHYRILNRLDELKKYDVAIRYNSNCSQLRYKSLDVLDLWPKFKTVEMYASLDGSWARGEFIRKGQNWNKFLENRKQMKLRAPNINFSINYTLTLLNCFHAMEFHKEMYETGVIDNINNFRLNFAFEPKYLCVRVLPCEYKEKLKTQVENYINEFLIPNNAHAVADNFRSLISFMFVEDQSKLLTEFDYNMTRLDNLRNEDWRTVFPEIAGIV